MKSPAEKATCTSTFTAPFSPCNTLDPVQSFLETWCRAHCPFLSLLSYTDPPSFPSLFPKRLNFSVHSSLTALASHHHNPTSVTSDPPPLSPKVQTGSTGSNGLHAHPCVPSLPKTQPGIFESQLHLLENLDSFISFVDQTWIQSQELCFSP